MKIFDAKESSIIKIIRPIEESILDRLAYECLRITSDNENREIYGRFYQTKYSLEDLSSKEKKLIQDLEKLHESYGELVRVGMQEKSYCWVKINTSIMENIAYRYYFAPNPKYMHDVVRCITASFVRNKVPVRFKFQLARKMDECDRIIIYSDYSHKELVEKSLKEVYQKYPTLFEGAERAIPWVFESAVPNVYFTPETPGFSYGEAFADMMIQAKEIFCYLYGMTKKNSKLTLNKKDTIDYLKWIICSLMLRNGLLLSKDGRTIYVRDKGIRSIYDYESGVLKSVYQDNNGYYRVEYLPLKEGREALLQNFYNVSRVQPQKGVQVTHLTLEERRRETYQALYGDKENVRKK